MISYWKAINLAKNTELSNFIVVSTDSDDIKKIALKNGVDCWFKRPHDLSKDNVPKVEVINHALIKAERHFNKKFDTVIDLDVTAPLTTVDDVIGALNLYENNNHEFVTTGCEKRAIFNMIEVKRINKLVNESNNPIPWIYDLNAAVYVYSRNFLILKSGLYIMPQDRLWYRYNWDLEYVK